MAVLRQDGINRASFAEISVPAHWLRRQENQSPRQNRAQRHIRRRGKIEAIAFDVVDINYPYNAIFGRNTLVKFAAVIHQSYLCMKIPSAGGVVTVYGNQEEARRCEHNAYSTNKTVHIIEASEEDTEAFVAEDTQRN